MAKYKKGKFKAIDNRIKHKILPQTIKTLLMAKIDTMHQYNEELQHEAVGLCLEEMVNIGVVSRYATAISEDRSSVNVSVVLNVNDPTPNWIPMKITVAEVQSA